MLFQSANPYLQVCLWQITAYITIIPAQHCPSLQKPKSSIDKEPYQYLVIKKQQQL
jgi:hypothetical protein